MASSFSFVQIKNTFKYKYFARFFAGTTSYRIGMFIAYTAEASELLAAKAASFRI